LKRFIHIILFRRRPVVKTYFEGSREKKRKDAAEAKAARTTFYREKKQGRNHVGEQEAPVALPLEGVLNHRQDERSEFERGGSPGSLPGEGVLNPGNSKDGQSWTLPRTLGWRKRSGRY
jgi:hypothetical protein